MKFSSKPKQWRNTARAIFAALTVFLGLAESSRGQTPPCALMIATNFSQNTVNAVVSVPWAFTGVYKSNALNLSYCSNYISSSSAAGVPIGSYICWCVDWNTDIASGPISYTGHVLATCDPNLNLNLTNLVLWHAAGLWTNPTVYVPPATWQKVNYLLNHRGNAFFYDVQLAIWHFVGQRGPTDPFDPLQPIFNPPYNSNVFNALIATTEANAASWTPKCGDVQGVILAVNKYPVAVQLLMIEVPIVGAACTTSVAVSKTVACLLPGNSCGTFGKLAAGYKGTADPGFCYQIVVSNPGNTTLTNLTVHDNMVGDITTNFFPNPHSSLAPGVSITNFFKMSWDVTTTNTVTASAASTTSLTNIVTATDSAVAKVDTAAVTCNVTLTAPCDLDGKTNDSHVLLPGCGGVCAVTFNVLVCNPSAVNLTNVTISSPALAALDCSLPAPFNLPAGTCINYQCTASLTCPGAPLNVNVSVVGSVQTDSAHCGYDISSVTPVQVVSTCNGMVECAPTTSSVSGFLFLDCSSTLGQNYLTNNPGPGLSGLTVNLLDAGSNIIASAVSGTNGGYAFTNLPFANYRVAVVAGTNLVQSFSVSGVNNNQMDVGATNCSGTSYVNFGYRDNLSASVNSGTVCDGTPLTMTATVGGISGPFTYAWTGPSGFTATTAAVSATAAGVYSVTVTDTNGCSATGMGTLTVNPAPSVTVNSGSVCAGSSLSLVATIVGGTGPFTYAWTGPAGFTAATSSISVSAAGTYNVTITDSKGCSVSGFGVLTINPKPSVLVNSGAVCAGGSLTMTASVTSGTAPFTYAWTGPNGFSAATSSISASAAGAYSVTVTDGNGCSGSGSGILTVNPIPTVTVNSGSVFQGNSLVMTATAGAGVAPFSYAWTGPNGFTASTASITVSVAGTYAVVITDANGCSSDPTVGHGILTVIPPVTIGNFVWNDANGNGVQDAGEAGIAGVTLTLTGTDINGGAVSATTVTDGNGLYSFSEPPGTYTVSVATPAGFVATTTGQGTRANDSNPNGSTVTLAAGGSDSTIDFGFYQPVTIGNYVWNDANGNGIQDGSETGIAGVTVTLTGTDGAGNPVSQTTTTDSNGLYSFTAAPGTYTVTVTTPAGYVATVSGQGTLATDSNPNGSSLTLASGGSDQTIDFGFYQPVTIGDYVWNDANANGIQDAGEIGLTNLTVTLTGTDGAGNAVSLTTLTDTNGNYSFSVAPGTYTVAVTTPAGYAPTTTGQGTAATDSNGSPAATTPATLASGGSDLTVDFGFYRAVVSVNSGSTCAGTPYVMTATISVGTGPFTYAWTGPNGFSAGTASINATDAGNYTVNVTDAQGAAGSASASLVVNATPVVTVNSGSVFQGNSLTLTASVSGGVAPFSYAWTGPAGFTATTASISVGTAGGYSVTVTDHNGCVGTGSGTLTVIPPVTIGNFVWNDANGNGVQDAGEAGIAGVTVTLTGTDINGGAVSTTTVTDGNGLYSFSEPPGTYTVSVATPAGFVATTTGQGTPANDSNPNGSTVTLAAGGSDSTIDFGFYQPVTIGNYVWIDANGNGIQDGSETGIAGVTVTLTGTDGAGNPVSQTTTTDSNGLYSFTAAPGTYTVTVTTPAGYVATVTGQGTPSTDSNPNGSSLTLTSGGTDQTIDFGFYQPAKIGDFVWNDANANGIQNAGEAGLTNLMVTLTGTDGAGNAVSQTTLTDTNGNYSFTVAPGTYTVTVATPAGYAPTITGQGTTATDSNGSPATTTPTVLVSGGSDLTVDFGFYQVVVTVNSGTTCAGSSFSLTASIAVGTGPYTYSWTGPNGFSSATSSISATDAGTYTVTVTDAQGAVATASGVLTVNALPTVAVNSPAICAGGSATLTATTTATNPSFIWSPGGATTASISVSPASTTTYSVTVTDGKTGCVSSPATGTVTVNAIPTASVNSVTICAGSSATLVATTTAAAPSYLWTPGGATTASITVSPSSTTTYSVTVTDGKTGCVSVPATGTVKVNPKPVVSVNSGATCAGSALTLSASVSSGTGPFTYAWTGPNGFSAATSSVSVTNAGTYGVTVTDSNGCTGSGSGVVTVNPKPVVTVNSGAVPQGSALTMTASVTSGTAPYSYAWSGPAGFTATTASISVTNAGTYSVTVTDANGCTGTGSGVLTVNPKPSVTVNSGAVCSGSAFSFTAAVTSGTAPFTYAWTGPAGFTASTASISATNAGTYAVTVTDGNSYTATASGNLTVNPKPAVVVNSAAVCAGSAVTLTATVTNCTGALTYAWSGPSSFTASTASISVTNAGTYTVTVTSASGCTGTGAGVLTVNPKPVVVVNSASVCSGRAATLTATVTNCTGALTYAWSVPSSFTASTASISVTNAGTYTVTVTSASGCTGTGAGVLTVNPKPVVVVNSAAVCAGTAATLTATVTNCTGALTYAWSGPSSFTASTASISVTNAGTYTVTVTSASGCTGTGSGAVTVSASPSAVITGPGTVCPSSLGNIYTAPAGLTYAWSITGGGAIIGSATAQSVSVSAASACSTNFVLTLKVTGAGGCTNISAGIVTVKSTTPPIIVCPANITRTNTVLPNYCTYNQSDWGATPRNDNAGGLLCTNFSRVYTNGYCQVGSTRFLRCTTPTALQTCLPFGGSPGYLPTNYVNPTTCAAGTFSSHVLCLQLNVDFSDSRAFPGCMGKLGDLVLDDTSSGCHGKSVRQILSLCNTALGGGNISTSGCSISDLDTLCDNLNNSCRGGTNNAWCISHLGCGTNTSNVPLPSVTGSPTVTDSCDSTPTVTYSDSVVNGSCAGSMVITRTWKAVDLCGNTSTCNQIITLVDNVAPVLTCPPNITITNAAAHTYCSFSETNWNCTPSGYNAGSLLCTNFANVYRTNGCIQIGLSTNKWVKCTTANSVRNCLPSTGTPTKLTACYTNPATCGGGTFGSHVLCLQLNVDFNDAAVIPGCSGKFGDLVYHDSTSPCDGKKVRDILNLCHKGIGGGDLSGDGCQISDLDGLCDNLNRSCEGGKVSDWCKAHLSEGTNCVPTTTQTGTATATDNCDAHPVISYTDVVTPGTTPGESVIFRTWKAVDSCGNVSTCTQTITISNPCGASISGSVIRDCDSNGQINANDLGFVGVAVTLKNTNGVVLAATTTDSNGAYSFKNLVAGKYMIVVVSPANCKQTLDPDAIMDGMKSVTLTNCQTVSAVNFAYAGNTPNCSVTVRGPSSCRVGDTITYTCTVTNTGNSCYTGGVDVSSPDCGSWHFTYPSPLGPGQSCVFTKTYTTQWYDYGNFTCHATATGHCSPGIGDTTGNHYCNTQVNW